MLKAGVTNCNRCFKRLIVVNRVTPGHSLSVWRVSVGLPWTSLWCQVRYIHGTRSSLHIPFVQFTNTYFIRRVFYIYK